MYGARGEVRRESRQERCQRERERDSQKERNDGWRGERVDLLAMLSHEYGLRSRSTETKEGSAPVKVRCSGSIKGFEKSEV